MIEPFVMTNKNSSVDLKAVVPGAREVFGPKSLTVPRLGGFCFIDYASDCLFFYIPGICSYLKTANLEIASSLYFDFLWGRGWPGSESSSPIPGILMVKVGQLQYLVYGFPSPFSLLTADYFRVMLNSRYCWVWTAAINAGTSVTSSTQAYCLN